MKYQNRLLAFFDILGFKEHLRKKDLDTLYREYGDFIDKANQDIFGDVKTIYGEPTVSNFNKSIIFSDSILLISYEIGSIQNINKFLLSCITLMQEAINHGFNLRGAIGHGEAIYDEEKNIFLSKEFAELYLKEGKQNWAGCGIFVNNEIKAKILNAVFGKRKDNGYQIWNEVTNTLLKEKVYESNIRASSPILEYKIPAFDENYCCLNYLFTMDKNEIEKLWKSLESEPKGKQCTTQKFYDYIFSHDDSGEVFENLEPIYKIKIMKTESSAKIKFEDKYGKGTDFQGQNITIGFI
ncbi:hypothetical protein ACRCD8_05445 [Aliarcobacter sp. ERUVET-8]|uniref:hypothetical protein n=1 Tax=Aliarcobacter sp. ERUVET-8 TaxID=3429684 RepID=UPI003D6B994F